MAGKLYHLRVLEEDEANADHVKDVSATAVNVMSGGQERTLYIWMMKNPAQALMKVMVQTCHSYPENVLNRFASMKN